MAHDSVVLLHLSDLHFGAFFGFQDSTSFLTAMDAALKQAKDVYGHTPQYLLFTGDLASHGRADEITGAANLLIAIADRNHIPHSHVVLTPGNHDVDWDATKTAASRAPRLPDNSPDPRHYRQTGRKLDQFLQTAARLYHSASDPSILLHPLPHTSKRCVRALLHSLLQSQQSPNLQPQQRRP
jgi:hypothetical protein